MIDFNHHWRPRRRHRVVLIGRIIRCRNALRTANHEDANNYKSHSRNTRVASILSFTFRIWQSGRFYHPGEVRPIEIRGGAEAQFIYAIWRWVHSCPGNELAKLEILVLMHHLTTNYRWPMLVRQLDLTDRGHSISVVAAIVALESTSLCLLFLRGAKVLAVSTLSLVTNWALSNSDWLSKLNLSPRLRVIGWKIVLVGFVIRIITICLRP
ncbi:hypothetical protein M8C21_021408 [Ambrosia artemisiifolia]|uniref:Uncharacterized protein n=1 Tax=Ambrosia artemisiifolia TaxID=4212 RepID=A0AAD5D644_AMBAR|nr:hypothetical protein M8C21_021408 [Ambrosia artemisiifolia]